jgi:hypothetical protein
VQLQSLKAVFATPEVVAPTGHSVHALLSVLSLKVLTPQASKMFTPRKVCPGVATHPEASVFLVSVVVPPVLQGAHVRSLCSSLL